MTQRTDAEHAKFKRAVAAHDRISAGDHFADWLAIGEAYAAVRDIAMRAAGTVRPHGVHYKRAWTEEMKNHAAWATYDPATRSQAIWLADNIGEVTRWRETLAINEREKFNHPAVVKRRYDAVHKEEGEFKNKPPSTVARLKEELEDSRGAVERMKREIETMKRSIDDFESRFNWDKDQAEAIAPIMYQTNRTKARTVWTLLGKLFQNKTPQAKKLPVEKSPEAP